jgi:hypothetical protein
MPVLLSLSQLDAEEGADPIATWDQDRTPLLIDYAWKWFNYHATQRLTAFNYFLIIVAILANGYLICVDKHLYALQVGLGLIGSIISIAFLAIDARNTQLVDDGRNALRKLERSMAMATGIHRADYQPDRQRTAFGELLLGKSLSRYCGKVPLAGRVMRLNMPTSHTIWLRRIERIVMLLFVFVMLSGAWQIAKNRRLIGVGHQAAPVHVHNTTVILP